MRKDIILYETYNSSPVPGIEAALLNSGDEEGIIFTSKDIKVIVYADGTIRPIRPYSTKSYDTKTFMRILENTDRNMFLVIRAIANDFKILALREECPDSYICERGKDLHVINSNLNAWEQETGRLIWLTKDQKLAIFSSHDDNGIITIKEMSDWFEANNIPSINTGRVVIEVDRLNRDLTLDICMNGRPKQEQEFDINSGESLKAQFDRMLECVRIAFGMEKQEDY